MELTDEVRDVTASWAKIRDKLPEVAEKLPEQARIPTLVSERRWDSYTTVVALVDRADPPLQPAILARWANELESRLRFVPGTRFTELFGLPKEEVRVEIEEEAIAATGLTLSDIAGKLRTRDSLAPDATSQTLRFNTRVGLSGDVEDLDRLRSVVIRGTEDGRLLRLRDLAEVTRTEQLPAQSLSLVDGRRAMAIGSRMDTDYIIDSRTARHRKVLEDFRQALPEGIELKTLFSQKQYTDERSNGLYVSLGLGMLLVIIVVWLMMGWRAALPICSALPPHAVSRVLSDDTVWRVAPSDVDCGADPRLGDADRQSDHRHR